MLTRWFRDISLEDVALVGGKNASLGEMIRALGPEGIRIPDGFAVTAEAYRLFLRETSLEKVIADELAGLDRQDVEALSARADRIRRTIIAAPMPVALLDAIRAYYDELSHGEDADVAVRSSATTEDLPGASFAGQQESYLHVCGMHAVVEAVKRAFASLFTARAISYREDMGFGRVDAALSVGIQKMVRSDRASSGVVFTLDPETGHRGVVLVTSSYGLGESVVQGKVAPDQLLVHKATLRAGFAPLVQRLLGTKETRVVRAEDGHLRTEEVGPAERAAWSLTDAEALTLARQAIAIEEHYTRRSGQDTPMDIEWAKDAITGELFIVQARPETVHARRVRPTLRLYSRSAHAVPLVEGIAVGDGVATAKPCVVRDIAAIAAFRPGSILVTDTTDPDWEPIMKCAAGIVTNRGGRTSHAAIVARELGIPAVVGCHDATRLLDGATKITVSCAEGERGRVYYGAVPFDVQEIDPQTLGRPRTRICLNIGNPENALRFALLPSDGVGLARMEFVFATWVGAHPLALTRFATLSDEIRSAVESRTAGYADKRRYGIERLSEGIGLIAAASHPRPVTLRFSDFKTNEYAKLAGGEIFEPREENPMLGWRGASRYYHPSYKEGFLLECAAVKRVREEMGLTNLKVMIPFCRTPEEGEKVLATMREAGLVRGENGLEVWMMAELPSNVLLADRFADLFDGFSIGSNDLTQLTLGVDRTSVTVAPLFDERNDAVKQSCVRLIEAAHRAGRPIGICGEAPSNYPDFAAFLVEAKIDSFSLSPDALVATTRSILATEKELDARRAPMTTPSRGPRASA